MENAQEICFLHWTFLQMLQPALMFQKINQLVNLRAKMIFLNVINQDYFLFPWGRKYHRQEAVIMFHEHSFI